MTPTALFVSPHLDDVAFSCGGTLISLSDAGWRTVVVTAFTASVPSPSGFALACQLDKGLSADVDYLAVRRAEDEEFARRAGVTQLRWLDLPEAPHRGYSTAADLFGSPAPSDGIATALWSSLAQCLDDAQPDLVFAPQALGGHIDHRHVAAAVFSVTPRSEVWWYRDVPYAIGQQTARPPLPMVDAMAERPVDITAALSRKCCAATAYATQLDFQFGGADRCVDTLRQHAVEEGRRVGLDGAAEVMRSCC